MHVQLTVILSCGAVYHVAHYDSNRFESVDEIRCLVQRASPHSVTVETMTKQLQNVLAKHTQFVFFSFPHQPKICLFRQISCHQRLTNADGLSRLCKFLFKMGWSSKASPTIFAAGKNWIKCLNKTKLRFSCQSFFVKPLSVLPLLTDWTDCEVQIASSADTNFE